MHAQPPRTLKRLLKQYGQELIDDPRRTEALLRDLCGQHTREIFVLVNAQKQRVPAELRDAPTWMPRQAVYTRLSRTLQTKLALTEDAADWAVMAWAAALDLDALPKGKGEGWSWLPDQLRPPAPTPTRKPRSKKRQNSPSGVQYTKESASKASATPGSAKSASTVSEVSRQTSSRKARYRAARAETGWNFSRFLSALPDFVWKIPLTWANLLPWIALVAAIIFLVAVVYWTSSARELAPSVGETSENGTPIAQSVQTGEENVVIPTNTNVTPLPNLPGPPSEYLSKLIPLPTSATVNVVTLYVRQQPTVDSDILDFLPEGGTVQVVAFSADGEWSQIEQPLQGWVNNDFILFESQDDTRTDLQLDIHLRRTQRYEVTVRAAPNVNAEVTATLSPDEPVVVAAFTGEPAMWYQIADPAIGWVAANDLAPVSP